MISYSDLISQFSSILFYSFSFILIISIIVFVHEYGHYIVAKICSVKVESFSIGFGPEIVGFNDKSGTRWKLSAIPVGGYVKMLGDANEASIQDDKIVLTDEEKLYSFRNKPLYKKALIVFAGPLANIIFAILIFAFLFYKNGDYQTPPVVGKVLHGSVAEKSGLLPNDIIISVNGKKIKYFEDIRRIVLLNPGIRLKIKYQRHDQEHIVSVIPNAVEGKDMFGNDIKVGLIGIIPQNAQSFIKLSIFDSMIKSVDEVYKTINLTLSAIGQIITGHRSTEEIGGPIKIAKLSGQSVKGSIKQGNLLAILSFMAMISINLGVMNLLPIPMLDGGHLFQYIIEAIFRRNFSLKYQTYAATIGTIVLLSLMIFATFNDISSLKK